MRREYWTVGKPGVVWVYLDTCPENDELIKSMSLKYPISSEYMLGSKRNRVAVTFEVPTNMIPSGFERLD